MRRFESFWGHSHVLLGSRRFLRCVYALGVAAGDNGNGGPPVPRARGMPLHQPLFSLLASCLFASSLLAPTRVNGQSGTGCPAPRPASAVSPIRYTDFRRDEHGQTGRPCDANAVYLASPLIGHPVGRQDLCNMTGQPFHQSGNIARNRLLLRFIGQDRASHRAHRDWQYP